MSSSLLQWFQQYPEWAIAISIVLNIAVALAGLLPSVFITAVNIYFFGFWQGTLVSIAGEAAGAAISFIAYRYWFKSYSQHHLERYPKVKQLVHAQGSQAAGMVFSLRLLPFVPSGIITLAAAIGSISLPWFLLASTTGKIPALLIEALAVQGFLASSWPLQAGIAALGLILFLMLLYRKANRS